MKYVMSDLHGRYDKYIAMLKKINFSDEDELYILGDICDRGPSSAQIYLDIIKRENIHCIMGNHEKMLLEHLPSTFGFLMLKHGDVVLTDFETWRANGGGSTCISFVGVGKEKILNIYNRISSFPLYRVVEVDKKRYLLVHGGLCNYHYSKPLCEYLPEELIWFRIDYDGTYYPMEFDKIIVGHTPTFCLNNRNVIYHGRGNVIDIDCGAVFEEAGGCLGCLCLETMEEFYA